MMNPGITAGARRADSLQRAARSPLRSCSETRTPRLPRRPVTGHLDHQDTAVPRLECAWNAFAAKRNRRDETDTRPRGAPTRSSHGSAGCNAWRGMSENLSVQPI